MANSLKSLNTRLMFLFFLFFLFICQTFIHCASSDVSHVGQTKLDNADLQDRLFGFSSEAIKRRKAQMKKHKKQENAPLIFQDFTSNEPTEENLYVQHPKDQPITRKVEASGKELKGNSAPREEAKVTIEEKRESQQTNRQVENKNNEIPVDSKEKNKPGESKQGNTNEKKGSRPTTEELNSSLAKETDVEHPSSHFRHSDDTNHVKKEIDRSEIHDSEKKPNKSESIKDSPTSNETEVNEIIKEDVHHSEMNESINLQNAGKSASTNTEESSNTPSSEYMYLSKGQTTEQNKTEEQNPIPANKQNEEKQESVNYEEPKNNTLSQKEKEESIKSNEPKDNILPQKEKEESVNFEEPKNNTLSQKEKEESIKSDEPKDNILPQKERKEAVSEPTNENDQNKQLEEALLEIKENPAKRESLSNLPNGNDKNVVSGTSSEEVKVSKNSDKEEKDKIPESKPEEEKGKVEEVTKDGESHALTNNGTEKSQTQTNEQTDKKEITIEENKKVDEKENKEDSTKGGVENVITETQTSTNNMQESNVSNNDLQNNSINTTDETATTQINKEVDHTTSPLDQERSTTNHELENNVSPTKKSTPENTPLKEESPENTQDQLTELNSNSNIVREDLQPLHNKRFKDKISSNYIPIDHNTVLEYSRKKEEAPKQYAVEEDDTRNHNISEPKGQKNDAFFYQKKVLTKGKNDKNEYEYFQLKNNGLKVLGIVNKYSPIGSFSFSVECGGYDDFYDMPGTAHLLEHVLFYKSKKRNTTLLNELGIFSSKRNSRTNETTTNYFATSASDNIYDLLKLFSENIFYPIFEENDIANEVNEIHNEYITFENTLENCINTVSAHLADFKYSKSFIHGNYTTLCKNVLRSGLDIKKLLYDFHRKCYQPKNISLTILLGKKKDSNRSYHLKDIEDMVVDLFSTIQNEDILNEKISSKYVPAPSNPSYIETVHGSKKMKETETSFSPSKESTHRNSFVEVSNKSEFAIDTDKKGMYVELLKKEGWTDGIYFYWTTKLNTELFRRMERYGSLVFLKDICSNLKKDGLSYKLTVENKYAFNVEFRTVYNKHYLNYGVWITLTKKGKKNIDHIASIFTIFVKEMSALFNHESMGKGLNKYLLDYYREKDLITMKNYDSIDVNYTLNDLITFSNRMHYYSSDPNLVITVDSIFEDQEKNDFRNHIKITSLIGSLMKVENINVMQIVDAFQSSTESTISNTNIKYTVQESPYLVNSEEIVNNINLVLPEITVCPSGDITQVNHFDDSYFYCVPYNNREEYEYVKRKWGSTGSTENRYDFRVHSLTNHPCLLKSVYGYNIYFKRGMVDGSRVSADFIFYFPSLNYTYQEAIYAHIHVLVLQQRIRQELLSEYSNCFVRLNVRYIPGGYVLHIESYTDFFAELLQKVGDVLSVTRFPEYEEFAMAYEELNADVQSKGFNGVNYPIEIMHALLSRYEPTNQEISSSLNAYFFYPSYKEYTRILKEFFVNNYVNVLIYGYPLSFSSQEKEQQATLENNVNAESNEKSGNENTEANNRVPRDTKDVIFINDILNGNNGVSSVKEEKNQPPIERKSRKSRKQPTLEVAMNGRGTELTVQMCENFIKKVSNKVIKKSNSTFYSKQFNNKESVEITEERKMSGKENEKKEYTSLSVLYLIESKSVLTDLLITITADLMSADFVKLMKIRKRDGYTAKTQTFFTPSNMGGLLFLIQSENKDMQTLQADTCSFVKFISYELLNMDTPELVDKIRVLKDSYLTNNTIVSSNQEYTSLFEQLYYGKECFDKKIKIVKLFDEIINCPQILLKVIKDIVNHSKRIVFKENITGSSTEKEQNKENSVSNNHKCMYMMGKGSSGNESGAVSSSLQLRQGFVSNQIKNVNSEEDVEMSKEESAFLQKYDQYQQKAKKNQYKKLLFLPKFIQMQQKGIFQNIVDFVRNTKSQESKENYLDFKSCDEELSQQNFQVFDLYYIKNIRNFFLSEFKKEDQNNPKCSIDYEEIKKYCYTVNDIE